MGDIQFNGTQEEWDALLKSNKQINMQQQTSEIKMCTGCGRLNTDQPLGLNKHGEPYLACCPDNSYKEITAVDWLVKHWKKLQAKGEKMTWQQVIDITELSKAMEKQQMKDAYKHGQNNGYMFSDGVGNIIDAEQYYNQTYNK